MPSLQPAYQLNRAAKGSRAAQWLNPRQGELLIRSRAEGFEWVDKITEQLKTCPKNKRAELLIAKSLVLEALGEQSMLQAAQEAWNYTKTSTTAHMMAVAYHHFGDLKQACHYYLLAHRYPHEAGFNVDLAYTQSLLFLGRWTEAHKETLKLKKRMVYAAYLPEWKMARGGKLSLVSEGGYGDLWFCGRWVPILQEMVDELTIYLPQMFFDSGWVDLMRANGWPEMKLLTETPRNVPAVGFFDLPAVFDVQPDNIPPPLCIKSSAVNDKYRGGIGFCWRASASETPLTQLGVYRSLTDEDALLIVNSRPNAKWVSLQKDVALPGLETPALKSWSDTTSVIAGLDEVITVDTAILHLAACMGKKVCLPISGAADWKWGMDTEDSYSAWYPTVHMFKNNAWGFDVAVGKVIKELNA